MGEHKRLTSRRNSDAISMEDAEDLFRKKELTEENKLAL
jgi:hypothetical protein